MRYEDTVNGYVLYNPIQPQTVVYLTFKLFEWKKLKLQQSAIQKWNGVMPSVVNNGTGDGMLFNIPAQSKP